MGQLQQLVQTLRVLARTNELNRLCDAIDREEAEKRPIEDWSIAKDYVRSRLRRLG
jgi:hypothetical protein